MTPHEIAARIDAITSVNDVEQLQLLDAARESLSRSTITPEIYESVLRLFERFPDDDAYELFWSYLHLLERYRECEPFLVASVRRRPALLTVQMVDRLLNAGFSHVGSVNLCDLLDEVLANPQTSPQNRSLVAEYIERHASNRA